MDFLDGGDVSGQQGRMNQLTYHFVGDREALVAHMLCLKQRRCPHCSCGGSLNRHSFLFGNDHVVVGACRVRGQRVFCCNRGRRGGCGRSFSVFLAEVLPRHSVGASILWGLLRLLMAGVSLKAATESMRAPFALETLYHLVKRLRGRLDVVRVLLFGRCKPPACSRADPVVQTAAHLGLVFENVECPVAEFQQGFQRAFCG